jgi:hypothetical protein
MDQRLQEKLVDLRKMGSGPAADWLLANCPINSDQSGDAFSIIPRLSWQKNDQYRLAKHYLSKIPYASSHPYEAFASFMPTKKLVDLIGDFLPIDQTDKNLLRYHLTPVLTKSAKTDADRAAVNALLGKL